MCNLAWCAYGCRADGFLRPQTRAGPTKHELSVTWMAIGIQTRGGGGETTRAARIASWIQTHGGGRGCDPRWMEGLLDTDPRGEGGDTRWGKWIVPGILTHGGAAGWWRSPGT